MHPDHNTPTSTPPPAPSRGSRRLWNIVITMALGATMFAAGAVMLTPGANTAPRTGHGRTDEAPRGSIEALQARVARLPKDPGGWAALGMAYVQQARSTADPATYDRAEKALRTSLSVQGEGNTDAETAMGALAAARHDFPTALRWARKATTSGPYSSSAYGVLADAHTQLGHYDEADEAVQKMTDLRPDAASLARASYAFELKGNTTRARALMQRSLAAAATPADKAFAHSVLAGLDLQDANPREALARTQNALRTAPTDSALLETRARAYLALGDTTKAVADYNGLIGMGIAGGLVPSPSALVVLLGAVALGRTAFGVLLVIGYGFGMAATLTLAGLLLVRLRERIESHDRARTFRHNPVLRKLARTGPVITSVLVIAVGLGLMLRAAAGTG
ncbi:hypothetical protein SGRI78S_02137 [Streptomyces griseus subsp. griseus]